MSGVETLPRVSMPNVRGVTSRRTISFISPVKTPPWTAAPMATTSSGFKPLWGSLPKNSWTFLTTCGILVIPPTRITSSTSLAVILASFKHFSTGPKVLSTKSPTIDSNLARESLSCKCFGPDLSAVKYGIEISVSWVEESSILAFSAASRSLWSAGRSSLMSMPDSFSNSPLRKSTILESKSSPPRWVSPFVALTSKTPSPSSRMEMSKVPPPKS